MRNAAFLTRLCGRVFVGANFADLDSLRLAFCFPYGFGKEQKVSFKRLFFHCRLMIAPPRFVEGVFSAFFILSSPFSSQKRDFLIFGRLRTSARL
ncbi:MAG: hypothetical protein LBI57_08250 [Helicobacteraceae bacterium]|nr:hypothetical protein [Helicobacteraceae bacterium]